MAQTSNGKEKQVVNEGGEIDVNAKPHSILDMIRIARAKRELAEKENGGAEEAGKKTVAEKTVAKKSAKRTRAASGSAKVAEKAEKKVAETSVKTVSRKLDKGGLKALIRKHAIEKGVPVEFAEAVVQVESSFNPRARSRAGAVGLMQIKPSTARGLGFKGPASKLYDPNVNLHWGMTYLAGAYRLAGGDTCGAVLRYNAGHYAKRMTKGVRSYCAKVHRYVASL
ncbi:Soluble lytic murein transglycosylase precursor [Hartmannibacter diazotrophicus]|uniref:Soluble lytic murein transglycosylase n=2 Tax=Hartmannibacter diazotrophicus TaxID=1482074 RepID=A0A2C9D6E6_9HYPH|nr:Soluble lytic murein transglycosylase precursor [Hartmannibacter diazotrophicus]